MARVWPKRVADLVRKQGVRVWFVRHEPMLGNTTHVAADSWAISAAVSAVSHIPGSVVPTHTVGRHCNTAHDEVGAKW